MTDKFRRTHPLNITFTDGEAPTSNKLTAVASQARVGARLLEKAVGDLWNQGGDTFTNDFPLQQVNLARIVGEARLLNPIFYRLDQNITYVDLLGTKLTNKTEGYLQFAPVAASVAAVSGSTHLSSLKSNESDLSAAGDWWVDTTTGRWKTITPVTAVDSVTYTVNDSEWPIDGYNGPCVIPDPRQASFTGCRISQSGSTFSLHLPPRRPLAFASSSPGAYEMLRPDRYPSSTDVASNEAANTDLPYRLWQGQTTALADAHYRYHMPQELVDYLSTAAVGTAIPDGYIYLWDQDLGTIVEDVVFTKTSLAWVFTISSATVNFASKVSGSEGESSYSASNYSIICAGTSLTRAIFNLQKAMYTGTGSNKADFSSVNPHSCLYDLNPPGSSYSGHSSRYPTYAPSWVGAQWYADDHLYLHSRLGAMTDTAKKRDRFNGAMLGHLLLANADTTGAFNFLDATLPNDSFKIYFGNVTGPYLYADDANTLRWASQGVAGTLTDVVIMNSLGETGSGRLGIGTAVRSNESLFVRSLSGSNRIAATFMSDGSANGMEAYSLTSGIAVYGQTSSGTGINGYAGTTGTGVTGYSVNGTGIYAVSEAGRAAIIEGDLTNTVLATMRIVPTSAQPTGASLIGDMYVTSAGVLKICTVAGTPGTWVSVGAQV